MGDLLGSMIKPHTVVVRWLNGDNIGWKGTRGAQWRALDLVLWGLLQLRPYLIKREKAQSMERKIWRLEKEFMLPY